MPHFQNQHEDLSPKTVTLSKEQFDKLVELLTPGYELAQFYLAQATKPAPSDTAPSSEPSSLDL